MIFLIIILYYSGFIVQYHSCLQEALRAGPSVERAIINGNKAAIEEYPSLVALRRNSYQTCGGTIIGSKVVLTAAHCLHSRPIYNLDICAGSNYKNCYDGEIYDVKASIIHPKFDLELLDNDFGLLQTTKEFQLSKRVIIAQLVTEPVEPGSVVWACGFGIGQYDKEELQDIKLRVISQSSCKQRLPYNTITESMLCTYNRQGRDTCDGDSGGPLFYNGLLAGVTSWGIKCGLRYPAMYSNVFYAREWLKENIMLQSLWKNEEQTYY